MASFENKDSFLIVSFPFIEINKIPFAFHDNRARISIPLGKDHIGNIDADWLNEYTNLNNIIINKDGNYIINNDYIREIIRISNWEKIW